MDNELELRQRLDAWLQLLTCKRATQWNEDRCALHLIGVVVRAAFLRDPSTRHGIDEKFVALYTVRSLPSRYNYSRSAL